MTERVAFPLAVRRTETTTTKAPSAEVSTVQATTGLGALCAFIGLVIYLERSPGPTPVEKQAEQERIAQLEKQERLAAEEAPLINRAKNAVLETLRDPDSAQFGHVFVRYCKDLDCAEGDPTRGTPMVCGGVNAKNGFGGYTGYQVFIYGNGKLIPPGAAMEQLALANKICLD